MGSHFFHNITEYVFENVWAYTSLISGHFIKWVWLSKSPAHWYKLITMFGSLLSCVNACSRKYAQQECNLSVCNCMYLGLLCLITCLLKCALWDMAWNTSRVMWWGRDVMDSFIVWRLEEVERFLQEEELKDENIYHTNVNNYSNQ